MLLSPLRHPAHLGSSHIGEGSGELRRAQQQAEASLERYEGRAVAAAAAARRRSGHTRCSPLIWCAQDKQAVGAGPVSPGCDPVGPQQDGDGHARSDHRRHEAQHEDGAAGPRRGGTTAEGLGTACARGDLPPLSRPRFVLTLALRFPLARRVYAPGWFQSAGRRPLSPAARHQHQRPRCVCSVGVCARAGTLPGRALTGPLSFPVAAEGVLNVFVESTEEADMLVRHRLEVSQVESALRVVKRLLPKVRRAGLAWHDRAADCRPALSWCLSPLF